MAGPRYLDVELAFGGLRDGRCEVTASSDAGSVTVEVVAPLSADEVAAVRRALPASRRRRDVVAPADGPAEPVALRELGARLFDALFSGPVRRWFDRSRGYAQGRGLELRLVLRLGDTSPQGVPWELLFDPDLGGTGRHLGLGDVAIVRQFAARDAATTDAVPLPLRVLAMAAAPAGYPAIDVEKERRLLTKLLANQAGLIELRWVEGDSRAALQAALASDCNVFHFLGHGTPGALVLAGEHGVDECIAEVLATVLRRAQGLRLVVLNACEGATHATHDAYSSTATRLLAHRVPAVVAMQAPISDDAAITFARSFYNALASGASVGRAMNEARETMYADHVHGFEWATPVLYARGPDQPLVEAVAPTADELRARADAYVEAHRADLAVLALRRAILLEAAAGQRAPAPERVHFDATMAVAARARRMPASAARLAADWSEPLAAASIVWVTDAPHSVALEASALRARGFDVDVPTTRSVEEAMTLLESRAYDVVISDVALDHVEPFDEGYRVLGRLRAREQQTRRRATPFIFYTDIYDRPTMDAATVAHELRRRQTKALDAKATALEIEPGRLIDAVLDAVRRPLLCTFGGITVHLVSPPTSDAPPQVEARASGGWARYAIDPVALVSGSLAERERRLLEAWLELRRDDLVGHARALADGGQPPALRPLA